MRQSGQKLHVLARLGNATYLNASDIPGGRETLEAKWEWGVS